MDKCEASVNIKKKPSDLKKPWKYHAWLRKCHLVQNSKLAVFHPVVSALLLVIPSLHNNVVQLSVLLH
jgi:hypothetical protein